MTAYPSKLLDWHRCKAVEDNIAYIKSRLDSKQYHNLLKSVCLSLYRKNTQEK